MMDVDGPDGAARRQATAPTAIARGGVVVPESDVTIATSTNSNNNDLEVPLGLPQVRAGVSAI